MSMNKTPGFYISQNRWRLLKGNLSHNWKAFAGLLVSLIIMAVSIYHRTSFLTVGEPVSGKYKWYILLLIAFWRAISVMFADSFTPAVKINAATILYAYNTRYFQKELIKQWIKSLLKEGVAAFAIALLLNGFLVDSNWAVMSLRFSMYFFTATAGTWIVYHEKAAVRYLTRLAFIAVSCIFLSPLPYKDILFVLTIVFMICAERTHPNLEKYLQDMIRNDASAAAVSQNNYARMSQIAEENRPQTVRGITYGQFHPTKRNAIFFKGFIELLRTSSKIISIFVILILVGLLLARTNIFSDLPFLELSETRKVIGALCITMSINALYQMLIKQEQSILDKRLLGLPLPYPTGYVLFSYSLVVLCLNAGISLALGFILRQAPGKIVICMLGMTGGYLILNLSAVLKWKPQNVFVLTSTILIMAGTIIIVF